MADKSFFSRVFSKDTADSDIKSLQDRLDIVAGEAYDRESYDSKFIEAEASSSGGNFMANFTGVDQIVDTAALQRVYATETWVYGAVNAISDTVAALPIRLEKRREYKRTVFNDLLGDKETITNEAWEAAAGAKLNKLFQCPNPHTTKSEFINLICIDLLTSGDYYIYLDSDQDLSALAESAVNGEAAEANSPWGRLRSAMQQNTHIKAMYRIPPSMIRPVLDEGRACIAGYVLQTDKGTCVFDKAEIIHVKLPNPNDQLVGLSPLIPAFKPVLLDRFSTEHMIRFYKSGARLGGIITTDKALNKEQLGRFQRTFETNFTGRQNHHRTLILPPGMKYEQVEQNPAETALLEFCRYNREAILSAYRVPPIKLGILDNANYANARVQLKLFFTQTVKKYLDFIQEGFNTHPAMLLDNRDYRIQFDLSNVEELQEDLKEKAMAASEMLKAGATVDEVRESVWKKGPILGGNQSPVVVEMKAKERMGFNALDSESPNAPAEASTANQQAIEENQITDPTLSLNGAQVQAMIAIVQQVAQGFLPRASGIEMIIASFSVPRDAAERIMGEVGNTFSVSPDKPISEPTSVDAPGMGDTGKSEKEAMPDVQADTACLSDVTPTTATFSERVAQLVEAFVAGGIPIALAIRKAIEQARQEGFSDPEDDGPNNGGGTKPEEGVAQEPKNEEGKELGTQPGDAGASLVHTDIGTNKPKKEPCIACGKLDCQCEDKTGGKPSYAQFLSDEIAKLTDDVNITPALIADIKNRYEALGTVKEVSYANGHTKDSVTAHWKGFIEKTDPLIVKRHIELKKFFDKYKSIVMNRFGANLKSYGMHKARDNDDTDDILDPEAYKKLIDDYIAQIDKTLNSAMEAGYADTLVEFNFGPSTEEAKEALRKYALMSAKSVEETTREQLKIMLNDMFDSGKSVTEIGVAIRDKFAEIDMGRAMTIARTETMTAVSLGKAAKRTEWQQRFPEAKLMKMWVTAKDDRVRDTHEELEGVSVESNEAFDNGLMYPRDPSSDDASEVINCRCDVIDYAAEDKDLVESALDDEKFFHDIECPVYKGGPGSGCHGDNCGRPSSGRNEDVIVVGNGKPVRISDGGVTSGPPTVSTVEPRSADAIRDDLVRARDAAAIAEAALKEKPADQDARNTAGRARARVRELEREGRAAARERSKPKK